MNIELISQIIGGLAVPATAASAYLQGRHPDSKSARIATIAPKIIGTASYAFQKAGHATLMYGIGTARSILRSTEWGTRNRTLIATASMTAMGGFTLMNYNSPEDLFPLQATLLATASDHQNQGRYQRFLMTTAILGGGFPMALSKQNWGMALAELTAGCLYIKSIYHHDIKNAAGQNSSLMKNFQAYAHGILHNSVTGATKKGQVSTDIGAENVESLYATKLAERPNPYFNADNDNDTDDMPKVEPA